MAFPFHSQLASPSPCPSPSPSFHLPFRTYSSVFPSSTARFPINLGPPTTTSSSSSNGIKTVSVSTNAFSGTTGNSLGAASVFNRFRWKKISTSFRCFSALTAELRTTLDKVVTSQKVVIFMKGTKEFPQCGFSNTVVQILKSLNVPFETINILENQILREGLKEYSNWPTFPQLYIDGEFFGGCDITVEAYKNGQLQELLEKALCS